MALLLRCEANGGRSVRARNGRCKLDGRALVEARGGAKIDVEQFLDESLIMVRIEVHIRGRS